MLFLDELPEYAHSTLEALRQPLEDKNAHIARANHRGSYLADFMLVATQNPCPCSFASDPTKDCVCSAARIEHYQQKVSGPLLDRIDLFVSVSPVGHSQLLRKTSHNEHEQAQQTILKAWTLQHYRFGSDSKMNAILNNTDISNVAHLTAPAKKLLDQAGETLQLSVHSYFRTIKVARPSPTSTSQPPSKRHTSEALQYRPRR